MPEVNFTHPRTAPLHLRWNYGADLADVGVTPVVSGASGVLGQLRVLRSARTGEIDLLASAEEVATWPPGVIAIDILMLRGDVAGRLDTILIDLTEA